MLITIVWTLLGGYFVYLGIEIVFFKVTKRIGSLETHLYKNKHAFAMRVGLIELFFGLLIMAGSIIALINYKNPLFTYQIRETTQSIGYNIIPLGIGILLIVVMWINQKASEVKVNKTKKEKDEDTNDE